MRVPAAIPEPEGHPGALPFGAPLRGPRPIPSLAARWDGLSLDRVDGRRLPRRAPGSLGGSRLLRVPGAEAHGGVHLRFGVPVPGGHGEDAVLGEVEVDLHPDLARGR